MKQSIDLNADLGEDESKAGIARDLAMMDVISSCNIACGGHAGSPENMRRMLIAAKIGSVSAGAHPSYPDRANFGRESLDIATSDLAASLKLQLATAKEAAASVGIALSHIKPHGALYNDAQDRRDLADILVELANYEKLPLVGMAETVLAQTAKKSGVRYLDEAFIDRRYTDDSRLAPRNERGAVIEDDRARVAQAMALANGKSIIASSGRNLHISAKTLCLHSDSEGALQTARKVRLKLEQAGFSIEPVSDD